MAKEKRAKKPKSKVRKILEWVLTGLFVAVFGFLSVTQIIAMTTKGQNHNVPLYGNMQVLQILTDSMEPKYKVNGVVFVQKVEPSELKVGDDVTFIWNVQGYDIPMTHQLSEIKTPEETGTTHYEFVAHGINKESKQCAGDINGTATADCTDQTQTFSEGVLLGKVIGYSVVLGATFNFMTQPWGLLILLLIPALYLITTSVIDIVRAAKLDDEPQPASPDGEGGEVPPPLPDDKLSGLSEEDKKRLKEELLNEMMEERMKGGDK